MSWVGLSVPAYFPGKGVGQPAAGFFLHLDPWSRNRVNFSLLLGRTGSHGTGQGSRGTTWAQLSALRRGLGGVASIVPTRMIPEEAWLGLALMLSRPKQQGGGSQMTVECSFRD